MKALKWLLTVFFCPILFLCATAGNPNWAVISPTPQIHPKAMAPEGFKQACFTSHATGGDDFACRQYKRHEIAGFVLLPVGLGMAAGGGYMVYRGAVDISNNVNNINAGEQQGPYVPKHDIVLVSVGTAMAIVGLVLAPTGLSMGVSGAVRYRKHCTGHARSFYIGPSLQQPGLACRF